MPDYLALTTDDHLALEAGGALYLAAWVPGATQTVAVGSALRGPVAYGPTITQEDVVVPDIAARLYRRADLMTPVAQFANARQRAWRAQHNEAGSGSLVLQNDDADLAEIQDGDVIRFEYKGIAALSILVRERTRNSIAPGEELDQAETIAGPSTLAVLDEALVFPSRGVGALPIEQDRVFNWASFDFDDSAWGTASEMSLVIAGTGGADPPGIQTGPPEYWVNLSPLWPNGITKWIWGGGGTAVDAPDGLVYVRQSFYLSTQESCAVYAAGDNLIRVFLDGQELNYQGDPWNFGKQMVGPLSAGWHIIAASGENRPNVPGHLNPGGIAISVHLVDDLGNVASTPTLWSDRNWKMVAYPPGGPPGMTPGEVIRHCVAEAQVRGALAGLSLAFSDDVDSDGVAWPRVCDIATKVGNDLLTFVKELCATYIDVAMSPGEWRLYAWNKDGAGVDTAVAFRAPTAPTDPRSGNLAALTHKRVI